MCAREFSTSLYFSKWIFRDFIFQIIFSSSYLTERETADTSSISGGCCTESLNCFRKHGKMNYILEEWMHLIWLKITNWRNIQCHIKIKSILIAVGSLNSKMSLKTKTLLYTTRFWWDTGLYRVQYLIKIRRKYPYRRRTTTLKCHLKRKP